MKISEIFYSLQGEGQLLGVPSVFLRTAHCNLHCRWCDTPYTNWQPHIQDLSIEDIYHQLTHFKVKPIVITGGEPCLQPELPQLCELLHATGHHITLETNATLFMPLKAHLVSMSPKLANSVPDSTKAAHHQRQRLNPTVIHQFLTHHQCQVKFVVDHPTDLQEINELVHNIPIPKEQVILMPQGQHPAELAQRQHWLAEICKTEQYRYSPRLHITLWGNQPGT